jgi:hypothetical protein
MAQTIETGFSRDQLNETIRLGPDIFSKHITSQFEQLWNTRKIELQNK